MGLTLTVLGSTGSWPGPASACSGYLLRTEGGALWVDAGPGTMSNLQRHIALTDVTGVVISHGHHDHWSDLPSFEVACKWGAKRTGVPVFAPHRAAKYLSETEPGLTLTGVGEGDKAELGPFSLRFHMTDHYVPTVAVRIEAGGRVLGFTADTGPSWSPSVLGPVDALLSEATFPASEEREGSLHLSGRQAGLAAAAACVPRLLLTHFSPTYDRVAITAEATATFPGPVEAVIDNESYVI